MTTAAETRVRPLDPTTAPKAWKGYMSALEALNLSKGFPYGVLNSCHYTPDMTALDAEAVATAIAGFEHAATVAMRDKEARPADSFVAKSWELSAAYFLKKAWTLRALTSC